MTKLGSNNHSILILQLSPGPCPSNRNAQMVAPVFAFGPAPKRDPARFLWVPGLIAQSLGACTSCAIDASGWISGIRGHHTHKLQKAKTNQPETRKAGFCRPKSQRRLVSRREFSGMGGSQGSQLYVHLLKPENTCPI